MMRAERADFGRFSDPALLILSSLASGPKHGYAMMEDIRQFSGTHLEPGTLYGALARLEHRGWIEPLPADERRRPYRLTGVGATALREQVATMRRIVTVASERLPDA
ncbi:MAG: PadR family transcriptional regulator [Thermomicrobiales bacterium]